MRTELTIILFCISALFSYKTTINNNDKSLKEVNYFDSLLQKEKYSLNFESDTERGFIKIGNFLNEDKHNAIVVNFDSTTSFNLFELVNDEWNLIFNQNDVEMSRAYSIMPFIEDYNFDGIKDIALRNEVSNGTSIMTFHLWLNVKDTYIEVPEFRSIGNPTVIIKKNRIQGYSACCVFSEMRLTNYEWQDNKLRKMEQLKISNYPTGSGINSTIIERDGITKRVVEIKENEINRIIDKFSSNWRIIDTTANIGFASDGVTFFY